MTAIPSGTKFVGIGASVPTPENKSSQNNAFQEVYTIDDLKDSVLDTTTPPTEGDVLTFTSGAPSWEAPTGGSTTTTTVVNITSAQILAMGTTPIELLPAPASGKYYSDMKIILEISKNGGGFSFSTATTVSIFTGGGNLTGKFQAQALSAGGPDLPRVVEIPFLNLNNDVFLENSEIASGVFMTAIENPTGSLLTIKAIITYTVRTFGA